MLITLTYGIPLPPNAQSGREMADLVDSGAVHYCAIGQQPGVDGQKQDEPADRLSQEAHTAVMRVQARLGKGNLGGRGSHFLH